MTTTPLPTPHVRRAADALTKAIADDLYGTSSTGDVYDVVVKCENESWRDNAERIGAIAAENIRPALAAALDVEEIADALARKDGWNSVAEAKAYGQGKHVRFVEDAAAIRAEILGVDQ